MTYQEFKEELYTVVKEREEVKGKRVFLLEKGDMGQNEEAEGLIRYINKTFFEDEEAEILPEDFIGVIWGSSTVKSMLCIEVKEYFEKYRLAGWQIVYPEITERLYQASNNVDWLYAGRDGYERSKERLILRPVNYKNNKQELENCVFWMCGDIALTLYGVVYDSGENFVTMKIQKEIAESWQEPTDKLLMYALVNTGRLMPARLYYCSDLKQTHGYWEGCFMPSDRKKPRNASGVGERILRWDTPYRGVEATEDIAQIVIHSNREMEGTLGYRLTTTRGINGAIALFYPGVQERLAELMQGDFFVGFTSIHEAIVHPVSRQSAKCMKESIKEINAAFPKEEMLTNQVFRYSRQRKELLEV